MTEIWDYWNSLYPEPSGTTTAEPPLTTTYDCDGSGNCGTILQVTTRSIRFNGMMIRSMEPRKFPSLLFLMVPRSCFLSIFQIPIPVNFEADKNRISAERTRSTAIAMPTPMDRTARYSSPEMTTAQCPAMRCGGPIRICATTAATSAVVCTIAMAVV